MTDLALDWCSTEAARFAVTHWHYSRKMPVGKTARMGVWESGRFIGAVIYSSGSSGVGALSRRFHVEPSAVAELARVALTHHVSSVTRIVAISLRMMRRQFPKLRLIVSYADPAEGHIGAIYQGGNWLYTGRSSKDTAYLDPSGRRWHSRTVSETGYKVQMGVRARAPKPSQLTPVEVEPKYRYLMPLDEAMAALVAPLVRPYPKRASEASSDAPPLQGGEGGAAPTLTLQHRAEVLDGSA